MIARISITVVAVGVALGFATIGASSTSSDMPPAQPQPETISLGGVSFSLDATSEPQSHSEPLQMFLSEGPGATRFAFLGTYLVTAHVYGRHRNVTPGASRVLIELNGNGVSDNASFPEVASPDWRFFNQSIVGETTGFEPEPGEWTLRVDLSDGEIEILDVSIVATHAPSIS